VTAVDREGRALAASVLGASRVGVYTMLGAATGFVPLPWVPEALARRVRGAILEDVSARFLVTVGRAARDELSRPGGALPSAKGPVQQAATFLTTRVLARFARIGPLALYSPLRTALETYVFARLVERYLAKRGGSASRLELDEAKDLRRAIDAALAKALKARPEGFDFTVPRRPDDDRDALTATIDRVLIGAAGLPEWLLAHVDVAFDESLRHPEGG
jgi:hypothetical protein